MKIEAADEFIARKNAEWQRKPKLFKTKDIGRRGYNTWLREAWTFHVQHNAPQKVLVIERVRRGKAIGIRTFVGGAAEGDVEYRFGYYVVGQIGKTAGRWRWGQFSPLIPHEDLATLLDKARSDGTLL